MKTISQRASPFTGTVIPSDTPYWIVDGRAYDFSDWMLDHPGGAFWLRWSQGRDISILFHVYHRDPDRLQRLLEKYRIGTDGITPADVEPHMGVPPFLLDPDFDASRDLPTFEFARESSLLRLIRRRVDEEVGQATLRWWDRVYDLTSIILVAVHVLALIGMCADEIPVALGIGILVFSRTALAGAGHYYVHRRKPSIGESLFDINYVGTCLTAPDGHVMLHHPHTRTGADVKQTFFDGMLRLHPLFRVPGYTFHKLGCCVSGVIIRGVEVSFLERRQDTLRLEFWGVRLWLLMELAICLITGHGVAWCLQFFLTLWVNTFLVVASHDFEDGGKAPEFDGVPDALRDDWAAQQIVFSHDLTLCGNRWLDLFLSAGLSPHRVHHVLPGQRSGFANLASEGAVRSACAQVGLPWHRPRNFWTERLSPIIHRYLLSPPPSGQGGFADFVGYIVQGFYGIRAI